MTYSTFEDLRDAFLGGKVSEAELKERLIEEVNVLLEPVRQHFASDERAKGLLAKVKEWRRETLTPASSLTRLELEFAGDAAAPVFAAFAPQPSEYVRLSDVCGVLRRLRGAPEGSRIVLWLEDWSARALSSAGGSKECVKAWYELLLAGLRSLAPELMERVQVQWQGEAILKGPSDYWTDRKSVV